METGTSRVGAAVCLAGLALTAVGCGASGGRRRATPSSTRPPLAFRPGARAGAFATLRAGAAPPTWRVARISAGGALYYPPGWRLAPGDAGTATAVLLDARRRTVGYLNLTPRQGGETLADWTSFRVSHNVAEGERDVKSEAAARGVRFRTGIGACVRDSYTTISHTRFIELACLVRGARTTSVIVATAPPRAWRQTSPLLFRAIAALIT